MGNNNSNSNKSKASEEPEVRAAASQRPELEPEPPLIPTTFTWRYGGTEVLLTGSFSNWRESVVLKPSKSGDVMTYVLSLHPGTYEYKFIVDNQWRYDAKQPVVKGRNGNINNIIQVDAAPANDVTQVDEASNDAHYGTTIETDEDLSKEPPLLPPQLQLSLLNAPMDTMDPAIMPVPQHVVLNHLHVAKNDKVQAFATAHRFRKKYYTMVMFTKDQS